MRRLALLLLAPAFAAGCRAAAPVPAPTPSPEVAVGSPAAPDAPQADRSVFAAGLAASQQSVLSGLPGATVYQIALNISPDLQSVDGTEKILYTNTESMPLDQVAIHLLPNLLGGEMTLSAVRVDGADVEPVYSEGGGSITIPVAAPLAVGASVVLDLDFHVSVPQELQLNYGVLAAAEGVLAFAHGYPMVAVYDAEGWDVDEPPPYGDITYADASFYLVRVNAPADLVLCGSGVEVSRTEADGRQEVMLAAGPARDFYLAASSGYEVLTDTAGDVTVRTCAPAAMRDRAELVLESAGRALQRFSAWYAPYPYAKLDIIATPNLALGIEYPGAFALNQRLLTPEEDFGGTPEAYYLEPVTVHEAAHEWFYNLVGNDQLDDPWLDEALSQYATLRFFSDEYGPSGESGIRQSFYGRWDRVDRESIPIGKPVAAYSDGEYGAIVYGRGPLFFEALEDRMGTQAFDAFLRQYTAVFAWEEATPEGLRHLAETECGCDLGDLFTEWVY
jgi:aminopeptidase N